MKSTELFEEIIRRLTALNKDFQLSALEREMLVECCEKTVASAYDGEKQLEIFIMSSLNSFETCRSLMKAMAGALIPTDVDVIKLNYRGQTFTINKPPN